MLRRTGATPGNDPTRIEEPSPRTLEHDITVGANARRLRRLRRPESTQRVSRNRVQGPCGIISRWGANARRVRRLRRPETTQRVWRNRAQSRKLTSAISGCPDLMTPNQTFLRIYNRFCAIENQNFL